MANHTSFDAGSLLAPGPADPIDIHISEDSFPRVASLLADYPDICRIRAVSRKADTYLINHPDYVKRVLIDNNKNYRKGAGIERVKLLLGNGIIVSDGDFWKQQRRMVQPAFHRDMLANLANMMQQMTLNLAEKWRQAAASATPIDLNTQMSEFALELILRALFSDDLDTIIDMAGGDNPFAIFTDESSRDLNLAVKFRALTRLMLNIVEQRRAHSIEAPDMLSALMAARALDGQPMSDKALLDELMTLIVAGHETSATTLTWMWYLLSQHPDIEAKLQAEADALSVPLGSAVGFAQLAELNYCKQLMYETLRHYPPVWLFSRRNIEADTLGEYVIPAGSDIFIAPYFLHRRADFWPAPEQFQPERFTDEGIKAQHRVAFIPFSAGPRKCTGDMFATIEIQIHMATLAREFQLRYIPGRPITLEPAINLRSKYPITMLPVLRKN